MSSGECCTSQVTDKFSFANSPVNNVFVWAAMSIGGEGGDSCGNHAVPISGVRMGRRFRYHVGNHRLWALLRFSLSTEPLPSFQGSICEATAMLLEHMRM
jgi:hypothetical protein